MLTNPQAMTFQKMNIASHLSQILRTRYLQRHGFFFRKVMFNCLPDSRSHFNMAAFSSGAVLLYERKMCLHAISPISMKLGQFKGSTSKLKMTNWFIVWIFWWEIAHPTGLITFFTNKSALITGKSRKLSGHAGTSFVSYI